MTIFFKKAVSLTFPALSFTTNLKFNVSGSNLFVIGSRRGDWATWFKAAGIAEFKSAGGPLFETRALAIQAAIAQMGVVVIDPRFIEAELAAGQLTIPFPLRVTLDSAYWLAWRPGREVTRPVAAFRQWLTAEMAVSSSRRRREAL